MGNGKRVQILLSTYNGERYLREQLDSFLAQDYPYIDVLIRDDGSTDGTRAILKEYEQQYGFRVVFGENLGVNGSYFMLFQLADTTCNYFSLSDQDDVWLPDKLSKAVMNLEKMEEDRGDQRPHLFASLSSICNERLTAIGKTLCPIDAIDFFNAMIQNICPGHTEVFNRVLLEELRAIQAKEVFIIDHWIYLLSTAFGAVFFLPECTVLHRQHGNNAVGYAPTGIKLFWKRIKRYVAQSGKVDLGTVQLLAFFNNYGERLPLDYRMELERFFDSLPSLIKRFHYVTTGNAHRQGKGETILFKLLYIMGKYRLK